MDNDKVKDNIDTHDNKINSKMMLVLDVVLLCILLFIDQITKSLIRKAIIYKPKTIIKDVFELHYCENKGAAFGMLEGQRVFFIIIAAVVFLVIGYLLVKIPPEKKYIKLNIILVLILAGAFGNTIDRVALGYVRDFFYFKLIDFPIFNVADIYITVATAILLILVLFIYKESDLAFLNGSKKDE